MSGVHAQCAPLVAARGRDGDDRDTRVSRGRLRRSAISAERTVHENATPGANAGVAQRSAGCQTSVSLRTLLSNLIRLPVPRPLEPMACDLFGTECPGEGDAGVECRGLVARHVVLLALGRPARPW